MCVFARACLRLLCRCTHTHTYTHTHTHTHTHTVVDNEMHYGWEETTELALALLLKTALGKSGKGAEGVWGEGDMGGG